VGAPYGKEIDIWAVGCILGEIIDGNPMFPGENELDQLFLIQKCLGPLTPDHYETFLKNQRFLGMKFPEIHTLDSIDKRYLGKASPRAINFMKQLLKMNPAERLSAIDALKHPYFDGIRE
jgi:cyclin-dependent kinase-like